MKLYRYVDHQRLHIVTKDVISLSISVLLLFRHYISHKITFGAPSSGGVLRSACGAFIPTYADIFPNIYKKTFIFRHLVSYSWKASSHQLQSLASIPQGRARGKNLGHLFFLLKNHLYLKNIYYFIF